MTDIKRYEEYEDRYDPRYPNWFLYVIVFLVLFALLIEAGFLLIIGYSCYVKDSCYVPYFYGYGRYMAFPIVNLGGYSNGVNVWTSTYQECFVNGNKVNCTDVALYGNGTNVIDYFNRSPSRSSS